MRAIILAGGKGTRLAPYTTIFPKPMLPIGERPILEVVIKQLSIYGFNKITLSVGYLAELIQAYFNNNDHLPKGVELNFVQETQPLGTAGSLSLVPRPDDSCLVMNGDVLTTLDYSKLIDFHKSKKSVITIAMHKRKVKIDYGVLSSNTDSKVIDYTEKPTFDFLVSMGVYVFEPQAWEYIEFNKRLDFPDLIKRLLSLDKKVQGYPTEEFWLDIGRHDDYEKAIESFVEMEKKLLSKSQ